MDYNRCSKNCAHPQIVVDENKRKFKLANVRREYIRKIIVDGCLISDNRERCDYVFEIGRSCHCAIYIELKGADVEKAFSQLVATMIHLKERHKKSKIICYIVASRVPRCGPKVQQLKLQMARKYKALLIVGTQEVVASLDSPPYCDG